MQIYRFPQRNKWDQILSRPVLDAGRLIRQVQSVLEEVRQKGDEAVRKFTLEFDRVELEDPCVTEEQVSGAGEVIPDQLKKAIELARGNIEKFHSGQRLSEEVITIAPGVNCWQKSEPIEKVGLYIPGGSAPLISTVLMLGVPARLAGCREIVLCTPPRKDGSIHPAILYTAGMLGINKIFRIGGVQAIAAMAYGTETVPPVYKLFGPGNQYVTMAKMLVSLDGVAVDLPAGPSEVAILADRTADPAFIAADLLSQAEHGPDSQVLCLSDDEDLLNEVKREIGLQVKDLPRRDIALSALQNGRLVLLGSREEMVDMINDYAPEHLIVMMDDYQDVVGQLHNAGAVFLGAWAPVSAGDYASGTNHTLPTNGSARAYSGVGLDHFLKRISLQEITREGLMHLGPSIETLAKEEGLMAHKRSVRIRLGRNRET